MIFSTDTKGQIKVVWAVGPERAPAWKIAWIQNRIGDNDWAGTGRYLNVVRATSPAFVPAGHATDFPISKDCKLSDKQILAAFVQSISAITGQPLSEHYLSEI